MAQSKQACHVNHVATTTKHGGGFYESLPEFWRDADESAADAAVQTLHAAIVRLDLPVILQMTVAWHVHFDGEGRCHMRDAWLAWLQCQPDHRRAASVYVRDIKIGDRTATVTGHVRRAYGDAGKGEAVLEDTSRFTQTWIASDGAWLRCRSRTIPNTSTRPPAP